MVWDASEACSRLRLSDARLFRVREWSTPAGSRRRGAADTTKRPRSQDFTSPVHVFSCVFMLLQQTMEYVRGKRGLTRLQADTPAGESWAPDVRTEKSSELIPPIPLAPTQLKLQAVLLAWRTNVSPWHVAYFCTVTACQRSFVTILKGSPSSVKRGPGCSATGLLEKGRQLFTLRFRHLGLPLRHFLQRPLILHHLPFGGHSVPLFPQHSLHRSPAWST